MPTQTLTELPSRFFHGQDRLKGPLPPEPCAPSYRAEITGFPPMDAAGHGEFGRAFYAGFPDLTHAVDEVLVAGDNKKVVIRFTVKGTHTGSFMGIPATGRSVSIPAFAIMTIENDRVARLEGIFDQLGMMKQLGVVQG